MNQPVGIKLGPRTTIFLNENLAQIPSYDFPVNFNHIQASTFGVYCKHCSTKADFHLNTDIPERIKDFIDYHSICPDGRGNKYYR